MSVQCTPVTNMAKLITAEPVSILVAEDSQTQAARLKHTLEANKYRVSTAVNGRVALEMARAHKPTLVLSDIVMPEMDGYELCRQIKSDPQLQRMPVILVTSLSDPQDVIRGLVCRADNFIVKPYDERYLLSRIQFVLLNREINEREPCAMGVEIYFNGERHFIGADRLQILNLLLSTYEAAIQRNQELTRTKEELRLANTALEASNKELEAFSYSVSHDLRAPLRTIEGFTHSISDDYADKLNDEGKDLLVRVRNAAKRMGQLIDDLLNLSRLTRSEITRERADLGAIGRSIAEELQKTEPGRKVVFRIPDGLVADADPRLLRIAMENLLNNAWKFTSKRPDAVIELGMGRQNGETAYFVRDNGAGFDMAYADKLFGAFQRLHSTSEFPGTGIGLAIVQRVIRRHGGRIWAQGAVEQGAAFYFTL